MIPIYPENERATKRQLDSLMSEWRQAVGDAAFVSDGFYPYYFSQNVRILFMARESLDLAGQDYISALLEAYWDNAIGGAESWTVSRYPFHRRLMYLAYGLNHGCPDWEDIPDASALASRRNFAVEGGLSFAFMNLSKTSNDTGYWQSDWNRINASQTAAREGRNFIREEVELLDPDIIITANIQIPHLEPQLVSRSPEVDLYACRIEGKDVPIFNTYHFSAVKSDQRDFYLPVIRTWKEFERRKSSS